MPGRRSTKGRASRESPAERRELLIHLEPDLIRGLMLTALERGVTASSLIEEAVTAWLKRRGVRQSSRPEKAAAGKRQFLAKLPADLIREVKLLAIDAKVTASSMVGEAVGKLLEKRTKAPGKR